MSKRALIQCGLSLLLAGYLVAITVFYTSVSAEADHVKGLQIEVLDSISRGFVSAEDIDAELRGLSRHIVHYRHDSLNTLNLEKKIMTMDNIEKANCVFLNNGELLVQVTPLIPVARVFDTKGGDYYINRAGKRMKASTRYRMDVPVIVGNFNPNRQPMLCFPILDYLAKNPDLSKFFTAVEIKNNKDIILVPSVKGHVINIGDTENLDNKFTRLKIFYKKVMPIKGWDCYDTISVKWRGQIVAHQREAKARGPEILIEEHEDIDDVETMSAPEIHIPDDHNADKNKSDSKPKTDAKPKSDAKPNTDKNTKSKA